jgi:hypothetical protein
MLKPLEDLPFVWKAKTGRLGREEVTGDDRVRMIPHKRRPPVGPPRATPRPDNLEMPYDRAG